MSVELTLYRWERMIGLTVYIMRKERETSLDRGMSVEEQTESKENAAGIAQRRNDELGEEERWSDLQGILGEGSKVYIPGECRLKDY